MKFGKYIKPLRYEARKGEVYTVKIKGVDEADFGDYIYDVSVLTFELLNVNRNLDYSFYAINSEIYYRMPQKIKITDKRVAKELGVTPGEVIEGVADAWVNIDFIVAADMPVRGVTKNIGDTFEFRGIFANAIPKTLGRDGKFIYEDKEIPLKLLVERLPNYYGPDFTRGNASRGVIDPNAFFTIDFEAEYNGQLRR